MRKILFITATIVMIFIFGFVLVKGFEMGDLIVFGYSAIKDRNEDVKKQNDELTEMVEVKYPNELKTVDEAEKALKSKKEEYESLIALGSEDGSGYTAAIEKYEIEYLWTRIGNHAKDNDVDMKIDLTNSSMGSGFYKLNFTITGSYVGITDFIYSIENDSRLGFKIDNFVMTPDGSAQVKATFSCDEIGINLQSIDTQTASSPTQTTEKNTTGNTTNSSNTANTTNSTNTTNATN